MDQFEELFTQNPPAGPGGASPRLLGRLVLEADVHVLLSLRDDFLFHCQAHEALAADLLRPHSCWARSARAALRRALVQPALACGYRFEDEALVDEMVAGGRDGSAGRCRCSPSPPSRLWEKRDRERGLLTREAYRRDRRCRRARWRSTRRRRSSGSAHERVPLVRELFRNLVTAQRTRAARGAGGAALGLRRRASGDGSRCGRRVLDALVDARLLTSYECRSRTARAGHQPIEIIHESLLTAWPRLVRWLAQDADGALLRDQLRQAARLWEERRPTRRPAVDRAPRTGSTRCGGSATRARSPPPRRPSRVP